MSPWNWPQRPSPIEEIKAFNYTSSTLTRDVFTLKSEQLTDETSEIVSKSLLNNSRLNFQKHISPDGMRQQELEHSIQETYNDLLTKPPTVFLDYIDRFWPTSVVPFLVNTILENYNQTAKQVLELYVESEYIELLESFLDRIKKKMSIEAFDIAEILFLSWEKDFEPILEKLWDNIYNALIEKAKSENYSPACFKRAFHIVNRLNNAKIEGNSIVSNEAQQWLLQSLIKALWELYSKYHKNIKKSKPHIAWIQLDILNNILRTLIRLWDKGANKHLSDINKLLEQNIAFRNASKFPKK